MEIDIAGVFYGAIFDKVRHDKFYDHLQEFCAYLAVLEEMLV